MRRFRGGPIALLALVALLATACVASAPEASEPDETATPAPPTTATSAAEVTVQPSPTPQELATASATEEPRCPDPYVTPPPPVPTPDWAAPGPPRIGNPAEVPAPSPLDPGPLVPEPRLEALIRNRLGEDAEHYAIVVKDVGDGRGVGLNVDKVFYAASLFKLEVMYEIFHQRTAGLLDLDERYVVSDYYAGFDLGPLVLQPCETVTVRDALAAMMSVSDNVAAVLLQDRAGPRNINDAMEAIGLQDTRLTADGSLPATAADIALLLEGVARGQAVSQQASMEMIALMEQERFSDRIPRLLPDDVRIAHKTGNWSDATHDAAIIFGERSTYLLVLMSDLGFDSDAAAVEADVAKIVWDYFEQ